tara:strand:+ start:528 stop:1163 length:636 start_codon:yes stop_codon:yes gene_type:complete
MKLQITIPEKLSEITLSQYQSWLKVAEGKEITPFLQQKMIEIFCNVTLKQVLMIKATDIDSITNDINKVFKEKPKLITMFKLNEMEFGFIPKLDEVSFGEYIDLDSYLPNWDTMHKAMNVLFRPVTYKKKEKYLVSDYEGSGKYDLRNMTLDVVFGSIVFFWSLKNELQNHILNYLANQKEITISQELRDSLKSGAGINQSMAWPMETLEN